MSARTDAERHEDALAQQLEASKQHRRQVDHAIALKVEGLTVSAISRRLCITRETVEYLLVCGAFADYGMPRRVYLRCVEGRVKGNAQALALLSQLRRVLHAQQEQTS